MNVSFPAGVPELPEHLVAWLPEATASSWRTIAPLVPPGAYLAGGTGLTVHLLHRVSHDLDFMFPHEIDLPELRDILERAGRLFVTRLDDATLNAVFDGTRVQFLQASNQKQLAPTSSVGGIEVASIEDITAMKLKVILDRGELRDYFDLMEIDQRSAVPMEEGISLFLERYGVGSDDHRVTMLIRALGYLADVADDPALPADRVDIQTYWARRQPELADRLGRF